ncbi:MAG: SO2930 family diheme c-type cytochrome [Myxococcota bacterium]
MQFWKHPRSALMIALLVAAGCGDDGSGAGTDPEVDPCEGVTGDEPYVPPDGETCLELSSYGQISLDEEGNVVPAEGVLPYDLITPLFSDYSKKTRTVWMPDGTSAEYTGDGTVFDFPVGTIVTKTFAFPADLREPDRDVRVIETRVLIRREDGWESIPYIWNEEQTEAEKALIGGQFEVSWVHTDGSTRSTDDYQVPNRNQCIECHGATDPETGEKRQMLIGPKAKHLNRELDYGAFIPGETPDNQLVRWTQEGFLTGAPQDPTAAPALVPFDEPDPDEETLDDRARGYLDANCAHCHNPQGAAEASGLMLMTEVTEPHAWGVCQGLQRGVGGTVSHALVPGDSDASATPVRMDSDDPMTMMPRLGRSMIHEEGVALIRQWTEWLATDEAVEKHGLDEFGCWP